MQGSHLTQLELAGLVRCVQLEPDLQYLFRHALVQDAAYETILRRDRAQLHRTVAQVLEKLHGDRLDELAATLAQHFSAAGEAALALAYYRRAGDVAASQYANAVAAEHYGRALALSHQVSIEIAQLHYLYRQRGRLLELALDHPAALELYEQMVTHADRLDASRMRVAALVEQAKIYAIVSGQRDFDKSQALAEEALALARAIADPAGEARGLWCLLWVHWNRGDLDKALHCGEHSLALARTHDLKEQLAYTLTDLHWIYQEMDRTEQALNNLHESIALWRELGNLPMLADSLTRLAYLFYALGDLGAAWGRVEEAYQANLLVNNLWGQVDSLLLQGYLRIAQGRMGQALEDTATVVALSYQLDQPDWRLRACLARGWCCGMIGAYEEALEHSELAYLLLDQLQDVEPDLPASILANRALWHVGLGDRESAQRDLDAAQYWLAQEAGSTMTTETILAIVRGQLAQDALARPAALEALEAVVQQRRTQGIETPAGILAMQGQAQLLLQQGALAAARDVLEEALAKSEARGWSLLPWRLLTTLSQVETQAGCYEAAAQAQQAAQLGLQLLLDQLPAPYQSTVLQMDEAQQLRKGEQSDGSG